MKIQTALQSILFILTLLVPLGARAAEVRLDAQKVDVVENEEFIVDVRINTQEHINAVEGSIIVPEEYFDIIDILFGDSIVNFWIEKPAIQENGTIGFAGITPGGFTGTSNILFSLRLKARTPGNIPLSLGSIQALLNDGLGTPADVTYRHTVITVRKGDTVHRKEVIYDTTIPEDFTAILNRDAILFDNKYHVVFSTQDKDSGIDSYYVREGMFGRYKETTSPYILRDQELEKKIYIKARDKNGNERVVIVVPPDYLPISERIPWQGLLGLVSIILAILIYNKKRHV